MCPNGLWKYVSGQEKKPTNTGEGECKEGGHDAKSELTLIISPAELKQVKNCDGPKDIWCSLENKFST